MGLGTPTGRPSPGPNLDVRDLSPNSCPTRTSRAPERDSGWVKTEDPGTNRPNGSRNRRGPRAGSSLSETSVSFAPLQCSDVCPVHVHSGTPAPGRTKRDPQSSVRRKTLDTHGPDPSVSGKPELRTTRRTLCSGDGSTPPTSSLSSPGPSSSLESGGSRVRRRASGRQTVQTPSSGWVSRGLQTPRSVEDSGSGRWRRGCLGFRSPTAGPRTQVPTPTDPVGWDGPGSVPVVYRNDLTTRVACHPL